jgi:hypothetical protein
MKRLLYLIFAALLSLSACSSGSKPQAGNPPAAKVVSTTSTSLPHNLPRQGCATPDVPAGFTLDDARSGSLEPGQYSTSGDMQAAMLYDKYQGGVRSVYTRLQPAAGDLVVECVAMQFRTPTDAARFVSAYKALREQAGTLAQSVTPTASFGTTTLQYQEHNQGFAGYHIQSTEVLEMAAQTGDRFYTVAVAGPTPSSSLAVSLLRSLISQP